MRPVLIALAALAFVAVPAATAKKVPPSLPPNVFFKEDGRVIPPLAGVDPVTGRRVSLAAYAGRPLLVNVWGSWCPPCNREAPALRTFARRHPRTVVGLDILDSKSGARAFYRKYHLSYPSIFDPHADLAERAGAKGAPTTFFLDRRHRVQLALIGEGNLAAFEKGFGRVS